MVPAFPPKKIFTLTPAEVEQRREQLEKYMQAGKLGLPRPGCAGHWGTAHGFPPALLHSLGETLGRAKVAHLATPSLVLAFGGLVPWMPAPVPVLALYWHRGDVQGGPWLPQHTV